MEFAVLRSICRVELDMSIYQKGHDRTKTKSTLVSSFMNKILKLDFELDFDIIENSDFEVW